ncbi:MAG: NMD3-related protein, partial [Promethearchaeota archaeon]
MGKRVCPACGKQDACHWENLCEDCFKKSHPLIQKGTEIEILLCECGSIFNAGKWQRENSKHPEEELIRDAIKNAIKKSYTFNYPVKIKEVQYESLTTDFGALEGYSCQILLEGLPNPLLPPISEKLAIQTHIKWRRCEQCQKILTQQFAAILQVRLPEYDESILEQLLDECEAYCKHRIDSGDPEAYISFVKTAKKGMDLYLGSSGIANALGKILESKGAKLSKSYEAYGFDRMKTKWKQRLTIAAIFPPFARGAIVTFLSNENQPSKYFQLLDFRKGKVRAWNFLTNEEEFISDIWDSKWRKIADIEDFSKFQIVSFENDGKTTLLMELDDPWGY